MKFKDVLKAIKIAAAVGKSLATGKVAKTLDKVADAAQIADAVRQMVKQDKTK